jgi:hypothetical protein
VNPCQRVRSLKLDNKIVRYLSDEEKPRLLKAAKDIGGKFYLNVNLNDIWRGFVFLFGVIIFCRFHMLSI